MRPPCSDSPLVTIDPPVEVVTGHHLSHSDAYESAPSPPPRGRHRNVAAAPPDAVAALRSPPNLSAERAGDRHSRGAGRGRGPGRRVDPAPAEAVAAAALP